MKTIEKCRCYHSDSSLLIEFWQFFGIKRISILCGGSKHLGQEILLDPVLILNRLGQIFSEIVLYFHNFYHSLKYRSSQKKNLHYYVELANLFS